MYICIFSVIASNIASGIWNILHSCQTMRLDIFLCAMRDTAKV